MNISLVSLSPSKNNFFIRDRFEFFKKDSTWSSFLHKNKRFKVISVILLVVSIWSNFIQLLRASHRISFLNLVILVSLLVAVAWRTTVYFIETTGT